MEFENAEPLARTEDEYTSHRAADRLTHDGRRDSQKTQVLKWVRNHANDWPTAHELAEASGIPHPTVHKRLPDLKRDGFLVKGPKRTCRVTGEDAVTWGLPPEAPAAIDLKHAEQEKLF